jgi:hypothetical protein
VNEPRLLAQRRFPIQTIVVVLFLFFALIGSDNQRMIAYAWMIGMVALYVAITIHELGHLIAGFRMGYRFSIFSVGLLHVYKEGGRIKASLRRLPWQPPSFLGFTLFYVDDYTDFRRRMFWYILGGPLTNALLVIVSGLLYRGLPHISWYFFQPLDWMWGIFVFALFWLSILLLVGSLYPSEWVSTDGNKLLRLIRGGATLERFKAQVQIANDILQGVRPREWDEPLIAPLTALTESSADTVNSHLLAYRWALDRGDVQQAETYLTTAVKFRQKVSVLERANILVEAAYFEMRHRGNAQNADQWIKKLGTDQKRAEPIARLRMACAANLLLKHYAETKQIAQGAIQVLDRANTNLGLMIMDRDLFRDMAAQADEALKQGMAT